ncbi:proprotein convertase P-domain-containing protein [Pseudofulvimonas gallinarii]
MAVFGALPLAGVWQLTVSDNSAGDTGTLVYWCIVHEDQIFRNGFQP